MPPAASPVTQVAEAPMAHAYACLAALSDAMLAAAQRSDWDEVSALEGHCARQVEQLRQLAPEDCPPPAREHCMQLIRKVLANDATIRDLAQPWLKELEDILRIRRHGGPIRYFR